MGLLRESREVRKLKAFRRAEFALKQRFERIDWDEDVLIPEVEAMLAGRPVLGLEAGTAFDLVVEKPHADSDRPKTKKRA